MLNLKRYIGLAVLAVGIMVIGLGAFFLASGLDARNEIKAALAEEAVTTEIDGVQVPVDNQERLTYQANVIKEHTLGEYGPWQTIPRTLEDGTPNPDRQTFLNGLTLRNSLLMARMGLDLSNLVMALGGVFLALGGGMAVAGVVLVGMARFVTQPAWTARTQPQAVPAGGAD